MKKLTLMLLIGALLLGGCTAKNKESAENKKKNDDKITETSKEDNNTEEEEKQEESTDAEQVENSTPWTDYYWHDFDDKAYLDDNSIDYIKNKQDNALWFHDLAKTFIPYEINGIGDAIITTESGSFKIEETWDDLMVNEDDFFKAFPECNKTSTDVYDEKWCRVFHTDSDENGNISVSLNHKYEEVTLYKGGQSTDSIIINGTPELTKLELSGIDILTDGAKAMKELTEKYGRPSVIYYNGYYGEPRISIEWQPLHKERKYVGISLTYNIEFTDSSYTIGRLKSFSTGSNSWYNVEKNPELKELVDQQSWTTNDKN